MPSTSKTSKNPVGYSLGANIIYMLPVI